MTSRHSAAMICALAIAGCVHAPELAEWRIERDDQQPSDPANVFYSVGPLDVELAKKGSRAPDGVASFAWKAPLSDFFGLLLPLPATANSYYSRGHVIDLNCSDMSECIKYPGKAIKEGEGTELLRGHNHNARRDHS